MANRDFPIWLASMSRHLYKTNIHFAKDSLVGGYECVLCVLVNVFYTHIQHTPTSTIAKFDPLLTDLICLFVCSICSFLFRSENFEN